MVKNPVSQNAEGTHAYEDIINMEYPWKGKDTVRHPPMSRADRAKIFAPFAALRGYEDAIAEKEKTSSHR